MSERTLLSFPIIGVRKDNAKRLDLLFLRGLEQLLIYEGIDDNRIAGVIENYETIEFTKTDNRKALGNLNDLAQLYEHHILSKGGIKTCDLSAIIQNVNRTPQRNIGWSYSIDVVKEIVIDSFAGKT